MRLVKWAEETARQLLQHALPRRWQHVQQVAERSSHLAAKLGEDGDVLQAAAWLHDVGYAPNVAMTSFHPLDGARYLRDIDAPNRIVGLVAYHSSAASEAESLGLTEKLAEFDDERTLTRDLLWYSDMTIGPDGQIMTFPQRMSEVRERYAPDHYVVRAMEAGMAERQDAVARAQAWIAASGLAGHV